MVETSHVTIQGLKILGLPAVESSKPGLIRRLYAISRLSRDREDLYDGLTDAQAAELVKFFGGEHAKVTVLAFNTAHTNEHYGNVATYLRMKGLVPPSSEPRK
jgi:uncharacterized damage-inducible protein DinB